MDLEEAPQPDIFVIVDLTDGAKRCYHPICYRKAVDRGQETHGPGRTARMNSKYHCGHCHSCSGILWEARADCMNHDNGCPSTDFTMSRCFADFVTLWCLGHGWELCDDTVDTARILMSQANAPTEIEDLVAHTKYILDITA